MSPIDLTNFMVAPVACNQTSPVLSTDQLVIIYHQQASKFTPLCMCQIKDGRLSCLHLFLQVLYPLTLKVHQIGAPKKLLEKRGLGIMNLKSSGHFSYLQFSQNMDSQKTMFTFGR